MTTLTVQHIDIPSSIREARALERIRLQAEDELAGRTVWYAAALPGGRESAQSMRSGLDRTGAEVTAGWLEVPAGEPLANVAQQLEAMLGGAAAASPGPAEIEIYADGMADGESMIGRGVRPDDIVVLHDALTAVMAQAARERGAHVVWHVELSAAPQSAGATAAWEFLRRFTSAVDAYLMSSAEPSGRAAGARRISALMPYADVVAAKDVGTVNEPVGWRSALADVVHGDRGESVGGTLHARPAVAPR